MISKAILIQVRLRDYNFQHKYIYFIRKIIIREIFAQEEDDDVKPEEFVELERREVHACENVKRENLY